MKKITLLVIILSGFVVANAQQGFEVQLTLKNMEGAKLVLAYSGGSGYVMDTNVVLKNGVYIFKGNVAEPTLANVVIRKATLGIPAGRGFIPSPGLTIVLSNDKISITGDANEVYMAKVSGGKSNKEWNKIKAKEAQLTKENWLAMKNAHAQFATNKDSAVLKAAWATRSEVGKKSAALQQKFLQENPGSFVSLHFLSGMVNSLSVDELEKAFNKLAITYKSTEPAKRIAGKIESLKVTAIGQAAIELNKKDLNGNAVDLNTLKGKYVLLDFWGSWCGPCRKSHPHLKELYAKYKEKGFEIVGIAQEGGRDLADSRKSWKKAIAEDGINWIQVLNDEDMDKFDAVKSYGVSAFPTKVLLDKEGRIIARYVGDEEAFGKKLEEIFGK